MRKLIAVEDARAVMTEGMEWSAWRWLLEKGRVREIADRATAALDAADKKIKTTWPAEMKAAYAEPGMAGKSAKRKNGLNGGSQATDAISNEIKRAVEEVKKADARAERCRLAAEDMFDEAERQLSAELAREAARKALETYDLREAAIRKAEAAGERAQHNSDFKIHCPGDEPQWLKPRGFGGSGRHG